MEFSFTGEVIEWRGPAPFLFLPMPEDESDLLFEMLGALSYGWGCIAATVTIGGTRFSTSLMPRHGRFLVPVKVVVQRAEHVALGSEVAATVEVADP
jgi:hypothetical protein